MARTMKLDQTEMYRALIQTRETVDHEWVDYRAYGPYYSKSGCRDHGRGRSYGEKIAAGLRRRVTQQLYANEEFGLFWGDCD